MTEILKPEIDLDGGWELLMEKYKLNTVMSEIRIQAIWRRMKACAGPVVWYELQEEKREVLAASTLGAGIDRLQEEWVMLPIVWPWRLFCVCTVYWRQNFRKRDIISINIFLRRAVNPDSFLNIFRQIFICLRKG